MKKLTSKLLAGFSALGLMSIQSAEAQSFRTEADARAYLEQNPTGPRADEAFRTIIQGTIADKYPEFSRRSLSDGYASSGTGVPSAGTAPSGGPSGPPPATPEPSGPSGQYDNSGNGGVY